VQIKLIWDDPASGDRRQPTLETPIAIGSQFDQMPASIQDKRVSRMVIADPQISPYHATVEEVNEELIVSDRNSDAGTFVNNVRLPSSTLFDGDRLRLGNTEIQIRIGNLIDETGCDRMVGFLFKRRCGRTESINCPYCQGHTSDRDPYADDYAYYRGFGSYDSWGRQYYLNRDTYYYDSTTDSVAFTEADGVAFEEEMDSDFERNMGES
jgi:hypothetical protein